MKKTMVFNSDKQHYVWLDMNEENNNGYDFLKDRVCIIKGFRTIENKKFNGFYAYATFYCKSEKTAIRRFIKEVKNAGFEISEDEFESNINCYKECGYVVEVEREDDCWNIAYACYQN